MSKQDSVPRNEVSSKTHGDGWAATRKGSKNAPMSPTDRPWVEPYPGLLTGPQAERGREGYPCRSAMRVVGWELGVGVWHQKVCPTNAGVLFPNPAT